MKAFLLPTSRIMSCPRARTREAPCRACAHAVLQGRPFGTAPVRQLGRLGLVFEIYKLALTDELLDRVLGRKTDGETRTGRADAAACGYLSGPPLAAALRRGHGRPVLDALGRCGFCGGRGGAFLPAGALHGSVRQCHDRNVRPSRLFIQSSTDALGSTHRVVSLRLPRARAAQAADINDNLSDVAFDVLGPPVAVAVKGKGAEGDNLAGHRLPIWIRTCRDSFRSSRVRNSMKGTRVRCSAMRPFAMSITSARTVGDGAIAVGTVARLAACAHAARTARRACRRLDPAAGRLRVFGRQGHRAGQEGPGRARQRAAPTALDRERQDRPQQQGQAGQAIRALLQQARPPFRPDEAEAKSASRRSCTTTAGPPDAHRIPDGTFSRVEFSPWHVLSFDQNDTVADSTWYHDRQPCFERRAPRGEARRRARARPQRHARLGHSRQPRPRGDRHRAQPR